MNGDIKIENPINFPTWDNFQKKDVVGTIKGIIDYTVFNYDNEKIIATCRWSNSSPNDNSQKCFLYTEQGYNDACSWIKQRRADLIKQLL